MSADGSIIIETKLDNEKAEKELSKLKKDIEKMESSASKQEAKKSPLINQANELRQKIKEAQSEVEKYGKEWVAGIAGADKEQTAAIEKVNRLESEYQNVVVQIDKIDEKLLETYLSIEKNKVAAGELVQKLSASSETDRTVDTSAAKDAATKMGSIFEKIKSIILSGGNSIKNGLIGIGNAFVDLAKKVPSATKSIANFIKNGLKKIISYSGKATKSLLSLFKSSKNVNGSFSSGIKTMLKYAIGIRSLYTLFNKLRTAMTEGFKNLAQYSDSTNKSISMVKSALTQLKNSLATAFAPILTVVAPILTQFINMLSTAADYVARLTAALTGQKSYTRAVAVQEDYAASLENTASAADDAAGSLAGFDEINAIATENTASASGSSGEVSPSEMFETVEIEPLSFDSWGAAFSAFLDNLLTNGIPKLKEGLSSLADWLNRFSSNLYEMFTFPGVYDKVVALGAELAYALNDFVNQIDWATLGGALGAGLNLALGFLVSFIYNFDWLNLGASLATMVNSAVAEIDWYNVGMLLWAKFKIALETLAGFLLNLDMAQLAQAASNIMISFFNSMTETLQSIDWAGIGLQIATFLTNIDWNGIFSGMYPAIVAALESVRGFLTGFLSGFGDTAQPVIDIVNTIFDAIESLMGLTAEWASSINLQPISDAFTNLMNAVQPLVSVISDGLLWAYENVLLPLAGWIIEDAAPASVNAFSEAIDLVSTVLGIAIEGIKSLWDAIQPVINWIGDVAIVVIDGFGSIFEKVGGVFEEKGDQIQNIFTTIGSVISAFWSLVEPIFNALKNVVGVVFEFIGDIVSSVIGSAIDILSGLINFIVGVFTGDWQRAWDGISGIFKGLWNGIVSILEGAVNLIIKGINWLISQLNKVSFTLPDWVPVIGGKSFGFNIPSIGTVSIPRLATGAVIPPNREFLAVLGDQSSGNNIEAPESLIRKIVREESGNNDSYALLEAILAAIKAGQVIKVDKRVLGRTAAEGINDITVSSGKFALTF